MEVQIDKQRGELQEVKRVNNQMQDRLKQTEYQNKCQLKENEDLKYDNTLLYEKNVEKDSKIDQLND